MSSSDRGGERPPRVAPRRHTPLPDAQPKSLGDDPDAAERVQRLLDSDAYRPAHADANFLERDALRPSRLQLEYLKAELGLQEQGIQSTIVLFGGTRIVEPAAARRAVADLQLELAAAPGDSELSRRLTVAERLAEKAHYYDVAREFAALVSERCVAACKQGQYAIVTGGGPGVMEAGNRGATEAGAPSIGLNITLPMEQYPNPYQTPELCFQFRYFALRKLHFLKRARALVAFPGGYGTMDELFDALCLIQTRKIEPMPVVLVGQEFWERAIDFQFLVDEGVIEAEDVDLFRYAQTAEAIWAHIEGWYGEAAP